MIEVKMKNGFTILECALVVLVLILCSLLVIPYIAQQRRAAELRRLMANGRILATLLVDAPDYASAEHAKRHSEFLQADPEVFPNSTDFFREFLPWRSPSDPHFSCLGGCGVPKCVSSAPEALHATNNAWCLVTHIDRIRSDVAPLLFTRNVVLGRTGPNAVAKLSIDQPFGTNGWAFITMGLSAHYAEGGFIPFWKSGHQEETVLRP